MQSLIVMTLFASIADMEVPLVRINKQSETMNVHATEVDKCVTYATCASDRSDGHDDVILQTIHIRRSIISVKLTDRPRDRSMTTRAGTFTVKEELLPVSF